MAYKKSIYKTPTSSQIYASLKRKFNHPGTTLFRGRELVTLVNYTKSNPLPLNTKVLDLGCGEGYIGQIIFNRIDTGTDILPSELKRAKKTKIYKKLVLEDARKMSLRASYDLVFSNSVIEHIDGIDEVIHEVSRILKKGGLFIFTVPTKYFTQNLFFYNVFKSLGFKSLANFYSKKRNALLNHYNLFDHQEWTKKLSKQNLEVIEYQYYLDSRDIQLWDITCIILRLTEPLRPLNRLLKKFFGTLADNRLKLENIEKKGSSILIVASKK